MSRLKRFAIGGGILIGSVVVAVVLVARRPEPARRPAPSPVPFAETAPLVAGTGSITVHGAGTVRPRAEVDVTAEVAGRVVWVAQAFQSGGKVRSGELLFRIDDADYRTRVEQARASVAYQEVELLRVTEEARIARSQYDRFSALRQGGETGEDTGPLALWGPQMEAATAALARDQATLAAAELQLARTSVHAPFAGVVLDESVAVGQFVAAGRSVGRMYASDEVEVVVSLTDPGMALIPGLWQLEAGGSDRSLGARVVATYADARFGWQGYVDRAEAALDERTRTVEVVVRVPNPFGPGVPVYADAGSPAADQGGPPLLVGKFVEVEIDGVASDTYFRVRRPALRPGNEVWVVRNGTVHIVPVRVLHRSDDEAFLTGALEGGEQAIIGGIQVAVQGMPVRTGSGSGP